MHLHVAGIEGWNRFLSSARSCTVRFSAMSKRTADSSSKEDYGNEHRCRRQRKLNPYRALLRRPWERIAGRPDSWLAVERRVVGEADGSAPVGGASRHHLRPPRLWTLEQGGSWIPLR